MDTGSVNPPATAPASAFRQERSEIAGTLVHFPKFACIWLVIQCSCFAYSEQQLTDRSILRRSTCVRVEHQVLQFVCQPQFVQTAAGMFLVKALQ
jgi:hypothetical protein